MGNDLNSKNNLINSLNSSVMQDSWLDKLASADKAAKTAELKKVFTVISDNNVSATEKKALQTRAEKIQAQLKSYEAEIKVLEGKIEENEAQIQKYTDEIANLVSSVQGKSQNLEEMQKKYVKNVIEDVFYLYERGDIGKDAIAGEITTRIKNNADKIAGAAEIQDLLDKLDDKQDEVSSLANEATKWIDKRSILDRKYSATTSAYKLLNKTIEQIGNTQTSYTNSDYDTKVPVYSLEKTSAVAELFANTKYNVASTNSDYGSNEQYNSTSTSSSSSKDATSSATSGNTITTTTTRTTTVTTTTTSYKKNTTSKDAGNTMNSNAQLAALGANYSTILDSLAKEGFTFKEAMYAMFDSKAGLFKNSNVVYDVSKQGSTPTYTINPAGDKETVDMFSNMASKIKSLWGVDAKNLSNSQTKTSTSTSTSSKVVSQNTRTIPQSTTSSSSSSSSLSSSLSPLLSRFTPTQRRSDPIGFTMGNTEYVFVTDKNSDGKFSDATEFVGAKDGSTWLDDLKALDLDGDGKLNKEELKSLKVLSSAYKESNSTHKSTTNINYALTSAYELGIEEIDLKGLESQVGQSTGTNDINGSEIFKDSFSFKMNGQTVTASRKDDTSEFMKTVYSTAYGKNFEVGLSDKQVEDVVAQTPETIDTFMQDHSDTVANIAVLANASQISQEVSLMFQQVLNRIEAQENMEITKATNKAASYSNRAGWSTTRDAIQKLAKSNGVEIDMEQAKGLYMTDDSLNAKDIYDKCVELKEQEESAQKEAEIEKQAWSAIILCLKNNINTTTSEITELLSSGEAKTADEVVEILKKKQNS